ncbi:NADH:ubiquinone oxidoreductase [Photobacterium damselae]|uniref:NADH:ubiquinone oxidoreductase n=1 Tax=Photobacterium damselae TaxID=38293 RepID=UPI00165DD51B|nr:NADH:ubiquinone oxidoreductase [Photobacterium damselae]
MKFGIIVVISVLAGILSGEHFHSFVLGVGVASLAVGMGYWVTFRTSSRYPQLAFLMLLLGLFTKIIVTIVGVMWGINKELLSSPFVFSLSYLAFLIIASYGYFKLREYQSNQSKKNISK